MYAIYMRPPFSMAWYRVVWVELTVQLFTICATAIANVSTGTEHGPLRAFIVETDTYSSCCGKHTWVSKQHTELTRSCHGGVAYSIGINSAMGLNFLNTNRPISSAGECYFKFPDRPTRNHYTTT